MSKPLIHLTTHQDQVKCFPGEFLGPAAFLLYRNACRAGGAAFDPKINANLIRIDLVPALLTALGASFSVKVAAEVVQAAENRASAILGARAEAGARLAELKERPYPFQVAGIDVLAARVSFILGDEMGLGKTVQALLAIPAGWGALVVCPASLKGEWAKAGARWRPDLRPRVLDRFELPGPGDLLIINYERLPVSKKEALTKALKEKDVLMADALDGARLAHMVLIADEAHYLKSSGAGRTQRFRELGRAVRRAGGRSWGLTGTPMPNSPMDLLNILTAFDLLKESFGNYIRFCDLMNGKKDYWGKWNFGAPKPGAGEALKRVMLRRRRAEVLPDLPTITYQDLDVDIKASARKASDAARAAMAAAGVDLQAVIEGRQGLGASSESVFTARRLLAEAKIPALIEIVEEYEIEKEPLIVFSAHRAPIDALAQLAGVRTITGDIGAAARSEVVAAFQRGDFNVIALTIKAGAVGFTLTRAAHVVMVDQEWTPDWNQQAVSRACRIGQQRGVIVKRMIAPDTIDGDVIGILDGKQALIDATVEKAAGPSTEVDPQQLMDLGGSDD